MKLQLRELKAARPTMPSQGLGPRRSVLPLLISFLFSHIVLASLLPPCPSPPLCRSPHILRLPPPFLFPSSFSLLFFFLSPVSPSHLSPRGLSLSPGACALSRTVGIRACDSRRAREEVLIPRFSPRRSSPFASSRDRFARRPDDYVPRIRTC